jgi:hypothetical protein
MRVRLKNSLLWWQDGSIVKLAERSGISRATLYRWKGSKTKSLPLPPWNSLVKLSLALDLDPVLLLDFNDAAPMDVVRDVVMSALLDAKASARSGLLREIGRYLFCEGAHWPQAYTDDPRAWHRARFDGTGAPGNRWARLHVKVPPRAGPQLWHWAYRTHHAKPRRYYWAPYGFVSRFEGVLSIDLYNGVRRNVPCPGDEFVVETWFGDGGSADFCVASLHPFSLALLPYDHPPTPHLPCVRFGDLSEGDS